MENSNHKWRRCPGFPDYEVSDSGQVRRATPGRGAKAGKVCQSFTHADKRITVSIRQGGKTYTRRPSRLVCEGWWGPPPFDGAEACHNDGDPQHNHYTNLRWDTRKGNFADMIEHGTRRSGERHHLAKLTAEQVGQIRDEYRAGGITQKEIGERVGLSQAQVSRIINGARW